MPAKGQPALDSIACLVGETVASRSPDILSVKLARTEPPQRSEVSVWLGGQS